MATGLECRRVRFRSHGQEGLRYPVLAVTAEGREVMHNRATARLGAWQPAVAKKFRREPAVFPPSSPAVPTEEHAGLREALRGWRARKAREMGVPPYTLFWDRSLDELCV